MDNNNKPKENLIDNKKESSTIPPKKSDKRHLESHEDSFLRIKEKADEVIKDSLDLAVQASQKIDKNIKEGIQKTKNSSVIQDVKEKATRLRTMDDEEKQKNKEKITQALIKIRDIIFELFEKFVGRIRVGTQYGKSSIYLLSDLAKLKELGIISEKEFEEKKKQILDRI